MTLYDEIKVDAESNQDTNTMIRIANTKSQGGSKRFLANSLTFLVFAIGCQFSRNANAQEPPRKIALLVGVSDYFDKNMQDLSYAENDVVSVGSELRRVGFETTVLQGRDATASASNQPSMVCFPLPRHWNPTRSCS